MVSTAAGLAAAGLVPYANSLTLFINARCPAAPRICVLMRLEARFWDSSGTHVVCSKNETPEYEAVAQSL